MPDEIAFMDLASLLKITPNTPLEKLGSALNASIFDASNIAGSLKQKGLITFTANYPGPNTIIITDAGKALIQEADSKSSAPIDPLDDSILNQLSGGKRLPIELQNTLNIRSRDLAMRLYKLSKQNLLIYELKNGGVELLLTEQGFLRSKGTQAPKPTMQAAQPMQQQSQQGPAPAPAQAPQQTPPMQAPRSNGSSRKTPYALLAVALIIIVLVVLYSMHKL